MSFLIEILRVFAVKSKSFLDEAFGFIDICGANLFISAKPNPAYSIKVKITKKGILAFAETLGRLCKC